MNDKNKNSILLGNEEKSKKKLKVLELFAGTECISNAFREKGHECYTIDWDEQFPSSWHVDVGTITVDDILERFGRPDVIFLGTDCTSFSVAGIGHHRRKNKETGNLDPISEYAKKCDEVNVHCKELIKQLKPTIQIWENPRGGFRKMWYVQDLKRTTTTYCQYGYRYMKPTDFFSNIELPLKPACKNGAPCHESAPRGSRNGLQGIKGAVERSKYPEELCRHIVTICENYFKNNK